MTLRRDVQECLAEVSDMRRTIMRKLLAAANLPASKMMNAGVLPLRNAGHGDEAERRAERCRTLLNQHNSEVLPRTVIIGQNFEIISVVADRLEDIYAGRFH